MKNKLLILFLLFFLSACNQFEKKFEGDWTITKAYYNNEPVTWDLYSNSFILNENKTCKLPTIDWEARHSQKKGSWNVFEKKGKVYLQIKSENRIFNRTFEVENLVQVKDSISNADFLRITLESDSIKLDCIKPIYQ